MRYTRCSLVSVDSWRSLSPFGLLAVSGLALVAIGCGSDDGGGTDPSTGGASAAVGGSGTGGAALSTGGSSASTGGGSSVGTGGSGTGGTSGNSGGTSSNTGGTTNNTGGTSSNTGGTTNNTGGASSNTGGTTSSTGGTSSGTGGTSSGTGGGSAVGTGGETAAGGTSLATGGTTGDTGGTTGDTGGTSGETGGTAGTGETGGTAGVVEVPTLVEPIARSGNSYVLEFGDLYFEVDADVGSRIVSFSLGDTEILSPKSLVASGDDTMKNNYGSTFWTSPQTDWSWPPIAALDSEPYSEVLVDSNSFTLESDVGSVGSDQVSFVKKFTAELAENRIRVDYTIRNEGSSAVEFAPWEVGRVTSGGITFFPMGPGGTRPPSSGMTEMQPAEVDGVAWFDWTSTLSGTDEKCLYDGAEGWLAHATDGVLLLRTFRDISISDAAPGETDVELYANITVGYEETEPQGPLTSIPADGETTWTVYWQLVPIPGDVTVEEGSASLVTFARSVAALAPVTG